MHSCWMFIDEEKTGMCMLGWICGVTKKERIANECTTESLIVPIIEEMLRECRLRWSRHICTRQGTAPICGVE